MSLHLITFHKWKQQTVSPHNTDETDEIPSDYMTDSKTMASVRLHNTHETNGMIPADSITVVVFLFVFFGGWTMPV